MSHLSRVRDEGRDGARGAVTCRLFGRASPWQNRRPLPVLGAPWSAGRDPHRVRATRDMDLVSVRRLVEALGREAARAPGLLAVERRDARVARDGEPGRAPGGPGHDRLADAAADPDGDDPGGPAEGQRDGPRAAGELEARQPDK